MPITSLILQLHITFLWLTGQASKVEKARQRTLAEVITSNKIKPKILVEIKDMDESTERIDIKGSRRRRHEKNTDT